MFFSIVPDARGIWRGLIRQHRKSRKAPVFGRLIGRDSITRCSRQHHHFSLLQDARHRDGALAAL
ncbi:MAG: hypothetical protein KGN36_01790, partial [Acidobacteriota bacterium]|nr:hypothetical protein [Acidobacteriota bacterium]